MKHEDFCRTYLRTLDADRAGSETGKDGFALLASPVVRRQLDTMRETAAGQITREDAVRRLAQLAFGRVNDAVGLALFPRETLPGDLDLSAVSEIKVTEKGVELKFIDRVRALESLCALLDSGGGDGAEELLRALEEPDDAR